MIVDTRLILEDLPRVSAVAIGDEDRIARADVVVSYSCAVGRPSHLNGVWQKRTSVPPIVGTNHDTRWGRQFAQTRPRARDMPEPHVSAIIGESDASVEIDGNIVRVLTLGEIEELTPPTCPTHTSNRPVRSEKKVTNLPSAETAASVSVLSQSVNRAEPGPGNWVLPEVVAPTKSPADDSESEKNRGGDRRGKPPPRPHPGLAGIVACIAPDTSDRRSPKRR